VFVPFAALEQVAALEIRLFSGVCAVPAHAAEGVIVVLVDDGAVFLHDAQHGADLVGEVVIEGGRVVDGLGEPDPAVHAGQEPVDAGAVGHVVAVVVLVLGADIRAVVDVAGDLGCAPYCLAGQDASAGVIVIVGAGGSGGAVPVPAVEPVTAVVAEVLEPAGDEGGEDVSWELLSRNELHLVRSAPAPVKAKKRA